MAAQEHDQRQIEDFASAHGAPRHWSGGARVGDARLRCLDPDQSPPLGTTDQRL